jgi:2-(1,2-epoxy-1,2-dihydrophenyl)acetyl-CoA isomerase
VASEQVKLSKQDTLAVITLDRPEARNALSPDMVADLGRALQHCQRPDVRAVLITGVGNAFCSGADVKDFVQVLEEAGPEALSEHLRQLANMLHQEVILPLRQLEKPVVAAINGVAAGAGFSLALACDLRLASNNARFLMAYANIGATADGGSTYLLPRLVGLGKALEIYSAAQPLSAEYASEMGLVNQVIPSADFQRHSLEIATRLSQVPTTAYGRVKALFNQCWDNTLEAQLEAEAEALSEIGMTRDFQEGIRAFSQKRQPWFQGI